MMSAKGMANAVKNSGIKNCKSADDALMKFWNAVCNYVSQNAEVRYTWVAFYAATTPPTPDPVVVLNCKINAAGTLKPCKLNNADAALAAMSEQMNANAATWTVTPDFKSSPNFTVSPGLVIPTIVLNASQSTNPDAALEAMCEKIITGIKKVTPVLSGSHNAAPPVVYTGATTSAVVT